MNLIIMTAKGSTKVALDARANTELIVREHIERSYPGIDMTRVITIANKDGTFSAFCCGEFFPLLSWKIGEEQNVIHERPESAETFWFFCSH